MCKSFVVDTNVLISFPEIVFLEGFRFFTSTRVVRELDGLKNTARVGYAARKASRCLLRGFKGGRLSLLEDVADVCVDEGLLLLCESGGMGLITNDLNLYLTASGKVEVVSLEEFLSKKVLVNDIDSEDGFGFRLREGRIGFQSSEGFRAYADSSIRLRERTVRAANLEQGFLLQGLLDERVRLLFVTGGAGTGKTFLTVAAALSSVVAGKYDQVLWTVPPVYVGDRDAYGFLPGDLSEKMDPFLGGIKSNCEELGIEFDTLQKGQQFDFLPFTMIRGLSLARSFVVADEMQNATRFEIKTLVSRVGKGSKLVILGDLDQSDKCAQFVGEGMLSVMVSLKDVCDLVGFVNLTKNQRGAVSQLSLKL